VIKQIDWWDSSATHQQPGDDDHGDGSAEVIFEMTIENVLPWTAETPHLYTALFAIASLKRGSSFLRHEYRLPDHLKASFFSTVVHSS